MSGGGFWYLKKVMTQLVKLSYKYGPLPDHEILFVTHAVLYRTADV